MLYLWLQQLFPKWVGEQRWICCRTTVAVRNRISIVWRTQEPTTKHHLYTV